VTSRISLFVLSATHSDAAGPGPGAIPSASGFTGSVAQLAPLLEPAREFDVPRPGPECSVVKVACGPLPAHGRARVGPRTMQNSRPTGRPVRSLSHGVRWDHARRSMPTSRRLSPLPSRTSGAPRSGSRSVSERELLADPQARAPQDDDHPAQPDALGTIPAARITAMISSTVGGRADIAALCCPATPRGGTSTSSPVTGAARRHPATRWIPLRPPLDGG
jgi:hypothetical protein